MEKPGYRTRPAGQSQPVALGINPETRRLLVVKSAVHFRADLGELASHIFDADTPGIHRPDFANYDYRKIRRPIYPLDRNVETAFTS